jgi:Bacterial dnaA  protein
MELVTLELDPRLTFDTYVVDPANRLAAAAARRVADRPGASYNPLLIYAASGLGKTHLLHAIGNLAREQNPNIAIAYDTVDHLMESADAALALGDQESFREQLRGRRMLLLDDAQRLANRPDAQEELLHVWDALATRGGQIVLASDRPPNELEGLDARLRTRLSAGLVTDIAPPDQDTRVALVARWVAALGQSLAPGVAESLARTAFSNIRELQGGLNRVLAVQELEERLVGVEEVSRLLGLAAAQRRSEEFTAFVSEIAGTVGEIVSRLTPEQRLAGAILRWEGEGYRTHRLEAALASAPTPEEAEAVIARFTADITRLDTAVQRIRDLDPGAPELARVDLLRDPSRVAESEALVQRVTDRVQAGGPTASAARTDGPRSGNGARRPAPPAEDEGPRAAALRALMEAAGERADVADEWFLTAEKVLWRWPDVEDWIVSEAG